MTCSIYIPRRFQATYATSSNLAAELELPVGQGEAEGITAYELRRGFMDSLNPPAGTSLTLMATKHGPRVVTDFDCMLYMTTPPEVWKPRFRQLRKRSPGLIRLREFFQPLA